MTSKRHQPDNFSRRENSSEQTAPEPNRKKRTLSKGEGLNIGLTVGATMAVFVIGGNWLDNRLGTSPWLTMAGAVFALVSVVTYLLRLGSR